MTIEERMDRLEHWAVGDAERRRQEREEDRALWRETDRRIALLTERMDKAAVRMDGMDERMERIHTEAIERDRKLGDRVEALVSAIGQFIAAQEKRYES